MQPTDRRTARYVTALRPLLMLLCLVVMWLGSRTPAQADECNHGCTWVNIYNCTSLDFDIKFILCCNGVIVISDPVHVPSIVDECRNPAASASFPPCTIIGIDNVSPNPPPGIDVHFDGCTVKID